MTRMIEDTAFRAEFAAFADENGETICVGLDEYGDQTVETRDTIQDFIGAGRNVDIDETRNGWRFVALRNGRKPILIADHGDARLCYAP